MIEIGSVLVQNGAWADVEFCRHKEKENKVDKESQGVYFPSSTGQGDLYYKT